MKEYIDPGDQLRIYYNASWNGEAIVRYVERPGDHLIQWVIEARCLASGSIDERDLKTARDVHNTRREIQIPMRVVARAIACAAMLRMGGDFIEASNAVRERYPH